MNKKTFKQFLSEAPISDYSTVGNFSKGYSFRNKTDRTLITNPRSIERAKKKFANSDINFNLLFVNSQQAKGYVEIGHVKPDYVLKNLGQEVYDALNRQMEETPDAINIIFTNNNGSERIPMTPWIMAHRMGHAFARRNNMRENFVYKQASEYLLDATRQLAELYNMHTLKSDETHMFRNRDSAKFMKNLFTHVATFRSARKEIIRDWFEVLNELIAQYITTGKIRFNPPPRSFKVGRNTFSIRDDEDFKYAEEIVDTLTRTMELAISDILSEAIGSVYIM